MAKISWGLGVVRSCASIFSLEVKQAWFCMISYIYMHTVDKSILKHSKYNTELQFSVAMMSTVSMGWFSFSLLAISILHHAGLYKFLWAGVMHNIWHKFKELDSMI